MKLATAAAGIAAASVVAVICTAPLAALASGHTFWDGLSDTYQPKYSGTVTHSGVKIGGNIGIQMVTYAQSVTQYGVYASATGNGTGAEVWHSSVTIDSRCFYTPWEDAAADNAWTVCSWWD
ncbi:hypothetical protein [Microbacterium gorillae]|uniref:hypothetical protein n=1 Tax=Microbacterium gorillae TaxID=1231063 RepID=UPI003D98C9BC